MRLIAAHTFKALLHEKIIFNALGITVLLLFFGYLASQLVYGHQDRVMLDVGITMNALSIFAVAIGVGSRFLRNEIENKIIYLYLSRPISRPTFFIGRFLGMASFIFLNYLVLTLILVIALTFVLGSVSTAFIQSFILTYLESLILLAASLLFGFWLRPALVFMVMLTMVFLGHNHELIGALNQFTPDLSILLMHDRVFYQQALSNQECLSAGAYGLFWVFFFILIGNAVFSRKNL